MCKSVYYIPEHQHQIPKYSLEISSSLLLHSLTNLRRNRPLHLPPPPREKCSARQTSFGTMTRPWTITFSGTRPDLLPTWKEPMGQRWFLWSGWWCWRFLKMLVIFNMLWWFLVIFDMQWWFYEWIHIPQLNTWPNKFLSSSTFATKKNVTSN